MPKPIDRQGRAVSADEAPVWITLAQWRALCAQRPGATAGADIDDGAVAEDGDDRVIDTALAAAVAAGRPLGLEFHPGDHPGEVASELSRFVAIAVRFPKFTDGRGLTTAHRLRTRLGWTGPLWAVGDILRDQLFPLARVGFDRFALRDDQDEAAAAAAFADYSVLYQPSVDEARPLWRRVERTAQASASGVAS